MVNSSQTRLITQWTRHKRAHNKTNSTSRNHLHAVSLRRHPETVLNTDGIITAICVTLMISLFVQGQKVQKCILQIPDHGDRLHFYEKHGQLVTTPWNTTVNSSHDFTMWPVDRVTSWLVPDKLTGSSIDAHSHCTDMNTSPEPAVCFAAINFIKQVVFDCLWSGWSKKRRDGRRDTWRSIRHGPLSRCCLRATDTRRDTSPWHCWSDGTDNETRLIARRYVVRRHVFNLNLRFVHH